MTDSGERAMHAYHEAGHVVVAIALGRQIVDASLNPPAFRVLMRDCPWADELTMTMAGNAAVAHAGGNMASRKDYDDADAVVAREGLNFMAVIDARRRADALIADHWPAVERVAAALLTRGQLNGVEVRDVFSGGLADENALLSLRHAMAVRTER